jgi:hypothetical protein
MNADSISLRRILEGSSRYVVPPFQRNYAWERPEWKKLWTDILARLETLGDQNNTVHFMGALIFYPLPHHPGNPPTHQIINGQQRLLTVSLLLCALRNTARSYSLGRLANEIEKRFLRDEFEKGRNEFRVAPRQRNRPEYRAAVTGERAPRGRIGSALRYFTKRLSEDVLVGASNAQGDNTALEGTQEKNLETAKGEFEEQQGSASAEEDGAASGEDSVEARLRELLTVLGDQLKFVHITLGDEADPHQIFELINESGVDLTQADLIRSQVMKHVAAERQEAFESEAWQPVEDHFAQEGFEGPSSGEIDNKAFSRFFMHDLLTEGSYVYKDDTKRTFKKRYIEEPKDFDPQKLSSRFQRKARLYGFLREGASHPSRPVADAIQQLVALDTTTAYPPVLLLLDMLDAGETTGRVVAAAVRRIAGFVLRRKVCNRPSRGFVRWFAFACKHMTDHKNGLLAGLTDFLKRKGFPSDEQFRKDFAAYDLYHADCTRAVLKELERDYTHREPADLSKVEVEHVMPQNLNMEWREDLGPDAESVHERLLHVPGNLTLSAYNFDLKDDPFRIKRKEYSRSNVQLTRHLAELDTWGAEQIEARSGALAKRAARIWAGPPFAKAAG